MAPHLIGRTLRRTEARLARRIFPDVATFVDNTEGRTVVDVQRHGKQMYVVLSGPVYLLIHLGMTGRLAVEETATMPSDDAWARHRHAVFHLDDRSRLVFTDPRTFGALKVETTLDFLRPMGPDPLTAAFDAAALVDRLKATASPVKAALLNQAWVAGLGNIYADEVLFLGGVHPAARGRDVSRARLAAVVGHIRPVLERAIEVGGATLKDGGYQDLFGRAGAYHPYAYGNTGEPCCQCETPIERGTLGPGRSARSYHFCPRCQPLRQRRRQ